MSYHQAPSVSDGLTLFAHANWRDDRRPFGIRDRDRLFHTYAVGKSGTGKSTLLETFMLQDLERGHGFALLDPHGDLAERVLDRVPKHRIDDVVYLNPADLEFPMPMNIIEAVEPDQRHLIASGLVSVFRRYWAAFWGPRTEYLVRNAVLALLEAPGATLLDMSRLFVDDAFRAETLRHVRNPAVARFWLEEYAAYPRDFRQEAIAPIQNKVGEFLLTPLIRNIVGQRRNLWHLRELMDSGKVLVVNLSKGRIGEDTASLLGSLLLTRLMLAALSRQDMPHEERRPFYVYVDEFHSFAMPSTYATLLSEGRKFAIGLVVANQFLSQIDDDLRSAIFGNVGTLISFRAGAEDAAYLSREFAGVVTADDLTGLDHHDIYLRLAVNGRTSAPFSGRTLCHPAPTTSYSAEIIQRSRERYTRRRAIVEQGAERHYLASRGVAMVGGDSRCSRPERRGNRLGQKPAALS